MYIIIDKRDESTAVIKEITPLSEHLGVSRTTIYNNLPVYGSKYKWETANYTVYRANKVQIKTRRGKS